MQQRPNIIIGPKILNPDLSLQASVINLPTASSLFAETFFLLYFFTPEISKKDFALSGACLLMKNEVYKKLNGLDENLFWMDDVDLCYRATQLNVECIYFTEWSVVHVIGQSTKKNYNIAISNQLISKLKFFRKHDQRFNFFFAVILTQIQIFLRIILFLILSPFKEVFRLKLVAYCFSQKEYLSFLLKGQNKLA